MFIGSIENIIRHVHTYFTYRKYETVLAVHVLTKSSDKRKLL
jgi:hypothetical protein